MLKPKLPINPVVRDLSEATSILINQMVYDFKRAGKDIVTLSLGEAFFDIPLFDFNALEIEKSYHYSESRGLPTLRQKFADYYRDHYGASVDARSEILISAGSKPVIFMAMLAALTPGDEVLIPEPSWLSYPEQARLVGAVPKFIPFDCKPDDFAPYITPKTKMLVLCNPNNPAGHIYTANELSALYEMCRNRGIYVLVDEAYSDFVIEDKFVSIASLVPSKDGIIVVNSISKNMGISGWRIGYIISHSDFIYQVLKLNQHIITCAPTILLMYCNRYFDDLLSITLPQVRKVVEKRNRVRDKIDEAGLGRLAGGATFYFFLSIGNFPGTSTEFALSLLLDKGIAVVPGSAYGQSTDRFVRISIGTESESRIASALSAIRRQTEVNDIGRDCLARKVAEFKQWAANLAPNGK